MRSRPIEHLENCRPNAKCTHTRKTAYTFLYFTTDLQRKPNRTDGFAEPKPNRTEPAVFLKTEPEPNLKYPFHTSLLSFPLTNKVVIVKPQALVHG